MDRLAFWSDFIRKNEIKTMAEIGVWRGDFAQHMLRECPSLEKYYLIDPWQMLDDWNKPLNADNLEEAFQETQTKLEPYSHKTVFLRGRTTEVAHKLGELDFAYIDGDHTLRGIVLDMMQVWPKIRDGRWLGGDDFSPSIWQHAPDYEPSMVFPFAVHFAEGVNCPITAIGGCQFVIEKVEGFRFDDQTGLYPTTEINPQIQSMPKSGGLVKRVARKLLSN